jgi:anti-anti-sigma factor
MPSPDHPNAGSGRHHGTPPGAGPQQSRTRWVGDLHGRLTIRLAETTGHTRAAVSGEIDHGCAPTLDAVLGDSLHEAGHRLDLDLGGVTFFDCGGLNVLLRARSLAERSGARLTVTAVGGAVERVLVLTGTRGLFVPLGPDGTAPSGGPGPDRPPDGAAPPRPLRRPRDGAAAAVAVRTARPAGAAVGLADPAPGGRTLPRRHAGRRSRDSGPAAGSDRPEGAGLLAGEP